MATNTNLNTNYSNTNRLKQKREANKEKQVVHNRGVLAKLYLMILSEVSYLMSIWYLNYVSEVSELFKGLSAWSCAMSLHHLTSTNSLSKQSWTARTYSNTCVICKIDCINLIQRLECNIQCINSMSWLIKTYVTVIHFECELMELIKLLINSSKIFSNSNEGIQYQQSKRK